MDLSEIEERPRIVFEEQIYKERKKLTRLMKSQKHMHMVQNQVNIVKKYRKNWVCFKILFKKRHLFCITF